MVLERDGRYQCEECGFWYATRELAAACEAWCREHGTCNIEITKHALPDGGK